MNNVSVRIIGLGELGRAFKAVGYAAETVGLKGAFLSIAYRVASRARSPMPVLSGRAARAVKAESSARGAAISFGGQAAPYGPWLDFGGSVGRGHRAGIGMSGAIKRDWLGREGRYVYPAISAEHEATVEAVESAMIGLARAEGF